MRIIVCGSRTFADAALLGRTLDRLTANLKTVVVVTGAAKGADRLAEEWAYRKGHAVVRYHADWDRHGNAAGPLRNAEMVRDAGARALIAFWDGRSPGTADAVARARKAGLMVRVIRYGRKAT